MKSKRKYFGITALLRSAKSPIMALGSAERRFFFVKHELVKAFKNQKYPQYAHDNVLSFQDLKDTFDVRCTFLDYGGLLAAILKDWKNAISHGNQAHTDEPTVTQLTVGNVSAKYARLLFAEKSFSLH